jgi:hypothetical protein
MGCSEATAVTDPLRHSRYDRLHFTLPFFFLYQVAALRPVSCVTIPDLRERGQRNQGPARSADKPLAKPEESSTLHIQKQTAVSSLLLGALAVRTYPEGSLVDLADDKLKGLIKMFNESVEGRLFLLIQQQELDKRKQAALYQDDWLTSVADDFAEEHVNSIFKIASDARDAIDDKFIRRVAGRAFYETTLAGG